MTAALPPFRLLSPAQYALLSAQERTDYLVRLKLDIEKHALAFRATNKLITKWLVEKDGMDGRK